MPVAKILARGQVTLPREVRRRAHIKPGDVVNIEVLGPGRVCFTTLPRLSPRELRDRFPIEGPIDEDSGRAAWQSAAADDAIGR